MWRISSYLISISTKTVFRGTVYCGYNDSGFNDFRPTYFLASADFLMDEIFQIFNPHTPIIVFTEWEMHVREKWAKQRLGSGRI